MGQAAALRLARESNAADLVGCSIEIVQFYSNSYAPYAPEQRIVQKYTNLRLANQLSPFSQQNLCIYAQIGLYPAWMFYYLCIYAQSSLRHRYPKRLPPIPVLTT